eukprot:1821801-Ditylum_brightwellii.AAC.1
MAQVAGTQQSTARIRTAQTRGLATNTTSTLEATSATTSLFDSAGIDDVPTKENDKENMYATFFDRVVIPARESVHRNALGEAITISQSDAATIKSGQCSEDALTVRILEADHKLVIVGGGPA